MGFTAPLADRARGGAKLCPRRRGRLTPRCRQYARERVVKRDLTPGWPGRSTNPRLRRQSCQYAINATTMGAKQSTPLYPNRALRADPSADDTSEDNLSGVVVSNERPPYTESKGGFFNLEHYLRDHERRMSTPERPLPVRGAHRSSRRTRSTFLKLETGPTSRSRSGPCGRRRGATTAGTSR